MLRGIDRAHDIDLGPSGHSGIGHHFMALADLPTPADIKRAEDLRADALRQRANREARRLTRPVCGEPVRKSGQPCARTPGHAHNGHRSRAALDNALLATRGTVPE
jgi:hypothetical protein